ncbi:hypothetical protein CBA19CS22_16325 [Caballeronia novacaledonica]|uniref:Uncharacterized protein n=1 Tax=Caballeronia novacaledonica TaxID=1544861 RepID=A0ACB5QSH3_9BURK|nr:hypothetical protein CBA19CS22_16325 [Caballeronia novacaledonica]
MRRKSDANHEVLKGILETLFLEDVSITVREVARRHPSLNNASAFTRSEERMEVIGSYQARQQELRSIKGKLARRGDEKLTTELSKAQERISMLESDVRALVASHAGMIAAVLKSGGMSALEGFWQDYRAVALTLQKLRAIPGTDNIVRLMPKS